MENYGIHWFRRDLRVAGNPALQLNWKAHSGRVVGLFCFDQKFLSRSDFSANRFQFFLNTLEGLQQELQSVGSDLIFLDTGPQEAFSQIIEIITKNKKIPPGLVTWNRDYEPFARDRDSKMERFFSEKGIPVQTDRDHCLIEPHEITKEAGKTSPYQVYSPFSRKWMDFFKTPGVQERLTKQEKGLQAFKKNGVKGKLFHLTWPEIWGAEPVPPLLKRYKDSNLKKVSIEIPQTGLSSALQRIGVFRGVIQSYGKNRDIPSIDGTSQLSCFFKNGSLTGSQVITELNLNRPGKLKESEEKFLKEIIWREFYYHVLWHFPEVEKTAFLEKFRNLKWQNKEKLFTAWKEGKTGYPIVDAGMRQLAETGWMHNRVRMIVASFLTKDLLIDWKWGEQYFMETLLDGDLAPNNGGWQWAASTGCDPQPYFRIFNPLLQSKKFDPEGTYIKKYVPELQHLSAKDIHAPGLQRPKNYPAPIVDHAVQRAEALKMYGARP